ncbi:MAG: SIMPL domain-containing protein [Candidatus Acidiferrales bacterium]
MYYKLLECILVFLFVVSPAFSQTVEVNRQNRTIEVDASETMRVDPDVADVTLGCVTYGQTNDQAYQANLAIANKVIKALLGAGVPKDQIESGSVQLSESAPYDNANQSPSERKARQFRAHQSWRIHVASAAAQKVIDVAVQAGANGIENVSWDVANPEALDARVRAAAMEKARTTAGEMAKSAGGKLGELLYASNVVNGNLPVNGRAFGTLAAVAGSPAPAYSLKLFPEKVERQATVRTVFALE